MDRPISGALRITFLVNAVISAILGLGLWLIPGRGLTFVGWIPSTIEVPGTDISAPGTVFVDPIVTRILGSALLAIALANFQGWRIRQWPEVSLLVQLEATFHFLSVVAFLVVGIWLQRGRLGLSAWLLFLYLLAFGIAWIVSLRRH